MKIEGMSAGDILVASFNEGAGHCTAVFYRVLKLGKVKVKVRSEYGQEGWMYPVVFDRVVPPQQADGINWN